MIPMRRNWLHSLVCVWAVGVVAGGGCKTGQLAPQVAAPKAPATPIAQPVSIGSGRAIVSIDPDPPVEGAITAKVGGPRSVSPDVQITTMSTAETAALLARLEPLPASGGKASPTMRAPSLSPPRPASV